MSLRPAVLLALLIAGATLASAQQPDYRVRAMIDPENDIHEMQELRLIVEAAGTGSPNIIPPPLTQLKNLQVVGGPSTSFNSVWSQGRFNSTSQLIYVLRPGGPGPAEIGPITLEIDGRTYRTEPIRFEVAPMRGGVPPGRSRSGNQARSGSRNGEDVFVRTEIGATDVWVGQAVPMTLALYVGAGVGIPGNLSWTAQPSLSRFWVETVKVDADAEAYNTTVEGRRYRVFPLDRRILVPQTSGAVEIEPFGMQMTVRAGTNRDPFDFFRRMKTVVRKSQPVTLNVRALPARGRPEGFGGAVGKFKLQVTLDRTESAVNDAVALTATVEGEGMLRAVGPPAFQPPPDVKIFDPEMDSKLDTARGKLVSRKAWKWVLVPLATGEIQLPEIRFDYFDPQRGGYVTASETLAPLVVRQSDQPADLPLARGEIHAQRRDLAFIKPLRGPLRESSPRAHERPLFLVLLAAPVFWVPAWVLLGRRRAHLERNRGVARSRKAGSRARKQLRAARRKMASGEAGVFHEEVSRALVGYVADRFDRAPAGLTYEMADDLLASRGTAPELRRRFRACLETCDFARYVPEASREDRRQEILDEATTVLERLEKAC